jgi:alkanesulfonate monooxygenase SsuD/methylene tetrahydromethanopterin reductase-like flavin-dependent oxidoreductase (luciferase family)
MLTFDVYTLNSYVPEADGSGPDLYRKWAEQTVAAEELGFDCAWFTEHHFRPFGGMLPSPPLLIAALAQQTRRIRLGTAVVILPLHNVVAVAEETAMLDILSGGRLEVGIGRGMDHQYLDVFDADASTAQERLEEQVAVLRAAWGPKPLHWNGRYVHCAAPVDVLPKPVQQPHPRLWVTANREPSHAYWIGRQGLHLMTIPWVLPDLESSRRMVAAYREGVRDAGHDPTQLEVLALCPAYVAETPQQVRAEAAEAWTRFRRISAAAQGAAPPGPDAIDLIIANERALFGDPATCRRRIQEIHDAIGMTRVALHFDFGGLSQAQVLGSMRRFMHEVAPAFTGA